MSRPDHAREIRYALTDARALCEALGLLAGKGTWTRQAGGVIVRCPWHDDRSPSCSVRPGPDGTLAVRCHGCGATGDALSLVAVVHRLDLRRDFRDVLRATAQLAGLWGIIAEMDAGAAAPDRTPVAAPAPSAEPPRDYPPLAEVEAFWRSLTTTEDDWEVADYLRARKLDPGAVDARELARALGPDWDCPSWAVCRGGTWAQAGYRLVVPVCDAQGALRSVRAARVTSGEGPKRLPPYGHLAAGLVMADEMGLAMLRGTRAPTLVIVCEGEPDFLTWATRTRDPSTAVVGVVAGGWTAGHAERVPTGARVVIRTDDDPAGHKYATEIKASLRGRCFVKRAA